MQKLSCGLLTFILSTTAVWADVTVKNDSNTDLALSIYSNTALVRDVRQVNLPSGKSSVLFAGVAAQMKPETLIVNGSGFTVHEQNYNFAMLSPENVARANKGKIVKTVIWDDEKAKNIYDKARVLDVYAGRPVLQFGYGIEFDFPGRIIWENLPDNLQTEPSLSLGVEAREGGNKSLGLMYLTDGMKWSTNYVAEFAGEDELNLKAWISINNTSGISYHNARVQVVAGEANLVYQPRMARPAMMKAMAVMDNAVGFAESAPMPTEESVGEYHVYSLPEKITIDDNQTKQISLLSKDRIKYQKEYRLSSPLYLGIGSQGGEFKKANTDVFVKMVNDKDSHLGEPLPQGVIRFYDRDSYGNMLFVGESHFRQLAFGDDTELRIGRSFDVTASGQIINLKKIADKTIEADVKVIFNNAKSNAVQVQFEQSLNNDWHILSESLEGQKKDARHMKWLVDVPAQGNAELNFKVRIVKADA